MMKRVEGRAWAASMMAMMAMMVMAAMGLAGCGDGRGGEEGRDPGDDPRAAATAASAVDPAAARAAPIVDPAAVPPKAAPADPYVACRELAESLARMQAIVEDSEAIPRERALYELAARLSLVRRELAIAGHELAIIDGEQAAPDDVLRPDGYRGRRKAERERIEVARDQALATAAALRDEALRSVFPKLVDDDGPIVVLMSIRWRDAAKHVRGYLAGCAADPGQVDGDALRDFVSAMTMLEQDTHDVGTRDLEQRLLAGEDLAGRLP